MSRQFSAHQIQCKPDTVWTMRCVGLPLLMLLGLLLCGAPALQEPPDQGPSIPEAEAIQVVLVSAEQMYTRPA